MAKKIILSGGGTAGHIFPIFALYNELKDKNGFKFLYVGSKKGPEKEIIKNQTNIPYKAISTGKWRRYWLKSFPALFLNIFDLFKVFLGVFQSFFILRKEKPDLVFAKGGYVSLPIVLASLFFKIPVITHESDVVMGLANRICAKIAKKICVSFSGEYYQDLPKEKMVYTGNPIRKEFYGKGVKGVEGLRGLRGDLPIVLVTGGSQGSRKINQIIFDLLPKLLDFSQIIHLTGFRDFQAAKLRRNTLESLKERYFVYDFLEKEMPEVMRKADLIISRAGANTLAEIASLSKPSILIPLPFAASDHQTKNAQVFEKNQAAILIKEEDLLKDNEFLIIIKKLLFNKEKLKETGKRAKELSKKDAALKIAEEIIKLK